MFKILAHSIKTGRVTQPDPFDAHPTFAFPRIDFEQCTMCEACAAVCPTAAISASSVDASTMRLALSYGSCIQCRACVTACEEGAIAPQRDSQLATYTRQQLTHSAVYVKNRLDERGRFLSIEPQDGPSIEESAARLRARVHQQFGRSLHVRQVDAGSCNGCELEITATTNPRFDLERFGIHFVASPRHADLLLVTGPVTRNMEMALRRTYEATPEPRVVMAVGACGCSGGLFGEGTYASVGGVGQVIPVDVYVPGCPPRPQAILNGLLVAMARRIGRAVPNAS